MLQALQSRLDAGDVAGALAACRARIVSAPREADAHRHLGQILAGCGEFLPAQGRQSSGSVRHKGG